MLAKLPKLIPHSQKSDIKQMKILVLENELTSNRGGQEWSLLDVCHGLAQRGHEIHLIYVKPGNLLANYQAFCQSLTQVDCSITYLVNTKGRSKTIVSSLALLRSLLQGLKVSPEVVYVNGYTNTFFSGILAQLKGVPLVSHLRNLPIQGEAFRWQIRTGLKAVTRFIAVSQATRDSYTRAGFDPKSIEVVYNGIDLERFTIKDDLNHTRSALGLAPADFVVLYAGRLDEGKNIELLLEAFAQLAQHSAQAKLLIVGSPVIHATPVAAEAYVHQLQHLSERLAISSRVQWLGRRTELPQLFRASDVSVLPSLIDTFGRVLVESMACGTPAIGLRFGGITEVLGGEFERFQVEVGDVSGLAKLLGSLQGWQQHDPALAQRCRTYVEERFPKEHMVMGVERVLQKALTLGAARLGPDAKSLQPWYPDALGI